MKNQVKIKKTLNKDKKNDRIVNIVGVSILTILISIIVYILINLK